MCGQGKLYIRREVKGEGRGSDISKGQRKVLTKLRAFGTKKWKHTNKMKSSALMDEWRTVELIIFTLITLSHHCCTIRESWTARCHQERRRRSTALLHCTKNVYAIAFQHNQRPTLRAGSHTGCDATRHISRAAPPHPSSSCKVSIATFPYKLLQDVPTVWHSNAVHRLACHTVVCTQLMDTAKQGFEGVTAQARPVNSISAQRPPVNSLWFSEVAKSRGTGKTPVCC